MDNLIEIVGDKVRLRPICMTDTNLIVLWRNQEHVRRNFIFREEFTCEMHLQWMETRVSSGEVVQYIIEEKESMKPIGSVYFRDINYDYRSAEFGIFIGEKEALGKGYGRETARLFTQFGFSSLGLHRISLRVLEENQIACRSYIAAGFKQEGVFCDMVYVDGKYHNVIFMAMLEE